MRYLKKLNELFDTDDLKSNLEIPYLSGDISKGWSKYANLNKKEDSKSYKDKIVWKYPILKKFNQKTINSGEDIYAFFATSQDEDSIYYAQICFYYEKGRYYIHIVIKEREEENQENWKKILFDFDNIEEVYGIVDDFLNACKKLDIFNSRQSFNELEN